MNTTLQSGDPIADGKYIIDHELGEGGLAVVYKVRHATLDTPIRRQDSQSDLTLFTRATHHRGTTASILTASQCCESNRRCQSGWISQPS